MLMVVGRFRSYSVHRMHAYRRYTVYSGSTIVRRMASCLDCALLIDSWSPAGSHAYIYIQKTRDRGREQLIFAQLQNVAALACVNVGSSPATAAARRGCYYR